MRVKLQGKIKSIF